MTNYTLYRHTFPNGKLYFGITNRPVLERWRKDGSGYKRNQLMWRAILKYGWGNIKHDILFTDLSEQCANELEIKLIAEYHTQDPAFGYNIMPGGLVASGWHHTAEAKKKMSDAQKGKYYLAEPWNKGKHYGKQKVYQYTLDGDFIAEFNNVYEASNTLNIPAANIFDNLNMHSKSCSGFIFSKILSDDIKYSGDPGAHKILIYQYNNTGALVATYRSYKAAIDAIGMCESNLEDCLNGRQKTVYGFVFSKIELTAQEVLEKYKMKLRKTKYKYFIIDRKTGEQTLYNNIDDLAAALNKKPAVIRNIINGQASKLHKLYIFKKELNTDEN